MGVLPPSAVTSSAVLAWVPAETTCDLSKQEFYFSLIARNGYDDWLPLNLSTHRFCASGQLLQGRFWPEIMQHVRRLSRHRHAQRTKRRTEPRAQGNAERAQSPEQRNRDSRTEGGNMRWNTGDTPAS